MEQLAARRAHNPKVVRFESHSRNQPFGEDSGRIERPGTEWSKKAFESHSRNQPFGEDSGRIERPGTEWSKKAFESHSRNQPFGEDSGHQTINSYKYYILYKSTKD